MVADTHSACRWTQHRIHRGPDPRKRPVRFRRGFSGKSASDRSADLCGISDDPPCTDCLWRALVRTPCFVIAAGAPGLDRGSPFRCRVYLRLSLSLRTLGIVPTAMLTALDGVVASLLSWLLFRQRQPLSTCLAAGCAGCGAFLLWWVAPGFWQTDVLALFCGLLFTAYAFHIERSAVTGAHPKDLWAFFGGVFLSMALVTLALALCFGSWSSVSRFSLADLETLFYTSFAAVLIPVVISTMLLRALSAVTLAFCAILEPVISIAFAYTLGLLSLPPLGWLGLGSILLSVIVQAGAAAANRAPAASEDDRIRSVEVGATETATGA
jgi:drug/metabolite transporter (DMT)-like permease